MERWSLGCTKRVRGPGASFYWPPSFQVAWTCPVSGSTTHPCHPVPVRAATPVSCQNSTAWIGSVLISTPLRRHMVFRFLSSDNSSTCFPSSKNLLTSFVLFFFPLSFFSFLWAYNFFNTLTHILVEFQKETMINPSVQFARFNLWG